MNTIRCIDPLVWTHVLALLLGFALGAWALRIRVRFWREGFERQYGRRLVAQRQLDHALETLRRRVPAIVQKG